MKGCPLLAPCMAAALAMTNADEYFTGDGTAYTLGQSSAGNCNMMSAFDFATSDYAALNDPQWDGLQNCGRCAEVSCADDRCADQAKSVVVQILDRCPECKHGDLDLSPSVFKTLTGSHPSRYKVKWKFVDCPVSGNVNYCLKGGSNNFWTAVQPTNVATGVKNLKINGQDTTMLGSAYYYLLDGVGETQTDLSSMTISMTDVNGNSIEETVSLTADSCTEGTNQFPSGGLTQPYQQGTPTVKSPTGPMNEPSTPAPTPTTTPTPTPTPTPTSTPTPILTLTPTPTKQMAPPTKTHLATADTPAPPQQQEILRSTLPVPVITADTPAPPQQQEILRSTLPVPVITADTPAPPQQQEILRSTLVPIITADTPAPPQQQEILRSTLVPIITADTPAPPQQQEILRSTLPVPIITADTPAPPQQQETLRSTLPVSTTYTVPMMTPLSTTASLPTTSPTTAPPTIAPKLPTKHKPELARMDDDDINDDIDNNINDDINDDIDNDINLDIDNDINDDVDVDDDIDDDSEIIQQLFDESSRVRPKTTPSPKKTFNSKTSTSTYVRSDNEWVTRPTQRKAGMPVAPSVAPSAALSTSSKQTADSKAVDDAVIKANTKSGETSNGTDPMIIILSALGAVGMVALIVVVVVAKRKNIQEQKARDVEVPSMISARSFSGHNTPSDRIRAFDIL